MARQYDISTGLIYTSRRKRLAAQLGAAPAPSNPGFAEAVLVPDAEPVAPCASPAIVKAPGARHTRQHLRLGVAGAGGRGAEGTAVIPLGARVWIAMGHTDMRKGMQGLALMVQQQLHRDPHGGDLFVFRGRIVSDVLRPRRGCGAGA